MDYFHAETDPEIFQEEGALFADKNISFIILYTFLEDFYF